MTKLQTAIEQKLETYYSDHLTKELFNEFFDWLDQCIVSTENWKNTKYDYMIYKSEYKNIFGSYREYDKKLFKLRAMFDITIKAGIISFNPSNHHKGIATEYYYNPLFIDSVEIKSEEKMKKIEDLNDYLDVRSKARQRPACRIGRDMFNILRSDKFQIDIEAAHDWILNKYQEGEINILKAKLYLLMVNDINYNNIFVIVGEKSKRVFTNFTCMKKELRQFCTLNGKKLMSVDMKSSVPYIFASTILKDNQDNKEIKEFFDIVTNRDIYKWVLDELSKVDKNVYTKQVEVTKEDEVTKKKYKTFDKETITLLERADVKPEFMSFIYSGRRSSHGFYWLFKEKFPTVLNILNSYKKDMASKLMTEESDIFIPVCRANKNISLSVHDSLYFTEEDKEVIVKALDERLAKKGYFGYELTEEK